MSTHRKALLRIAGLLALLALAVSPAAAEAANAPHWHLSTRSFPTVLVPGSAASDGSAFNTVPEYSTIITNVGAATTAGPITVTETLPPGITASSTPAPAILSASTGTCETPSPDEVVCEIDDTVYSSEALILAVPLEVSESAPTPAMSRVEVSGGGAPPAATTFTTAIGGSAPTFGFLAGAQGLYGGAVDENGLDANLAGSHPHSLVLEANFNTAKSRGLPLPVEELKNLRMQLPRGTVLNPQATSERCSEAELSSQGNLTNGVGGCGRASQIGMISIHTFTGAISPVTVALYNMQPPPGVAAEFAFNVLHTLIHIQGGVDGSFHLVGESSDILAKYSVLGIKLEFWGNPADPSHDRVRHGKGGCGSAAGGCSLSPGEANKSPFLTMPTSCGESLGLSGTARSWEGGIETRAITFTDAEGDPLVTSGCNALGFEPTIASKASTNVAESPSGLDFSIHQPQDESLEGRSNAALKDVHVALPEGMALNASAANGLDACSEAQMGYAPEGSKVRFTTTPQSCPAAAKVGTMEVKTPLLDHRLPGSVYVAKPFANPFGSLLAIYLAVEDEESGVIAKLAGKVEPDPVTGKLSATFTENPELPLEDIEVHFFGGEHGALTTPLTCGTHTTASTLTPWSTPEGADVQWTDSFQTSVGCASSEAAAPRDVAFSAGTVSPLAGAYSPFVLRLARKDGTQHIAGIETTLPKGLTGKLAGISYCPESAIALAKSREAPEKGREEQTSPSCPAASQVGTVQVTAGSGISPIPVSGRAYWAGPYKGAPLSMVVIVPAVAGPFDLGAVVSRVALYVGEYDARIRAVSDPLPTIREGIPLDVRSIELKLDRPGFTLNPTSCEASSISGSLTTQTGQSAPLSNRFQVGECGRLKFKPKLSLSLKGGTKRAAHPALRAVLTYPKGGDYANIARAQVSLPHAEFLDQSNIGTICTRPQLAANSCPPASIYGRAKAWTPLLASPLQGNVYLAGGFGHKLPDLIAELNGQIRVLLDGKVDTTKQHGIRNTFEAAPDAPVEKFVLEMKGGPKYGLLINSEDVCRKEQKAQASFTAANGKVLDLSPTIANSCKKARKSKPKRGRR